MQYREISRPFVLLVLVLLLVCGGVANRTLSAKNETIAQGAAATASPSPTPRNRDELPQDSDEVIKVETNLTNIFFTAADKNKRFITNLKAEDIRVFEDGQPQEVFTFQQNIDTPLSIAILIDTSISEQFTLPVEKAAAQAFLENVMRPQKDEAAVISFTGDTTLEQGFTGSVERLRRAIERVEFVPEPPDIDSFLPALLRYRVPTGKLVSDAYLAAFAMSSSRRLVTLDAGYRQFRGVELELLGG